MQCAKHAGHGLERDEDVKRGAKNWNDLMNRRKDHVGGRTEVRAKKRG